MVVWLDLLQSIDGLLGSLLGVVLGWWIARKSQTAGRTLCFASGWQMKFTVEDEWGNPSDTTPDNATSGKFECHTDWFNSRDVPVGFRGVRWSFRRGTTEILCKNVLDMGTRRTAAGGQFSWYEDLTVLNLPPKEMVHLRIGGYLDAEECAMVARADSVWIVASDHTGAALERKIADLRG